MLDENRYIKYMVYIMFTAIYNFRYFEEEIFL